MEKLKKRKPVKLRIKKDIPELTEENIDSVFNENFENFKEYASSEILNAAPVSFVKLES